MFTAAFSNPGATIEDQIAEADRVAIRPVRRGARTGVFHGPAPSGNNVAVSAMDMVRIEDHRIVERGFSQDELGLMRQVGAIPTSLGRAEPRADTMRA